MSSTWYEFKIISFSALERILILQKKKKLKSFSHVNQTVQFDQKNREPLIFAVFLALKIVLWKKS